MNSCDDLGLSSQAAEVVSDMAAFKAANPGCRFSDFVRWFSPNDWRPSEPEPEPEPEGRKDDEEQQQPQEQEQEQEEDVRVRLKIIRNARL